MLNEKIDFTKFDEGNVRQNEIWLPAVQFKPGIYTDQGYRFRENQFIMADHWFPFLGEGSKNFYDVTFFSSDPIVVDDDFTLIAEMYFRVKTDTV